MIDFIFKLFKSFNSSQTPWQMSLAISLGMAMGLTPFSGLQTVLLIALALLINIHIGLFLVSATFFSGFAYLADGAFESLGYTVLTLPSLEVFFTQAYNSVFMRLTYFNNTVVLGSNIIAFTLLLPLFFILNTLVYVYRDKIASYLQQYKIFKMIGIEVTGKKDKFFRIWGFGIIALFLGGLFIFSSYFLDSFLKTTLEATLTSTLKKKVGISDVDLSFKEAKLSLNNIYIADDKKVLARSDNINLNINFSELIFQNYHIDTMNVSGVELSSELRSGEVLYSKPIPTSQKTETSSLSLSSIAPKVDVETPKFVLEAPQTLLERLGLDSIKNFENAQKDSKDIDKKYKKIIVKEFSEKELRWYETEVKRFEKEIKRAVAKKDIPKLLSLQKEVKQFWDKAKNKHKRFKEVQASFKSDYKKFARHYRTLKGGATKDYNNLKSHYTLDQNGAMNVVGLAFGEKIKGYSTKALEYYKMAEPYLKSDDNTTEEEVVVSRADGRWIKFTKDTPDIKFFVKEVNVDGILNTQKFVARLNNISSNPKLSQPLKYVFSSSGDMYKELEAVGTDNHHDKTITTNTLFSLGSAKVDNLDLDMMTLTQAHYSIKGNLDISNYIMIDSKSNVSYQDVTLKLKKDDSYVLKNVGKVLRGINKFNLDVSINGAINNPNIEVSSDLDKKLSKAFNKVFQAEAKRYTKELNVLVKKEVNKKLKSIGIENQNLKALDKLFTTENRDINKLSSNLKSLESTIKKEIEKGAQDKVNNEVDKYIKNKDTRKLLKSIRFY